MFASKSTIRELLLLPAPVDKAISGKRKTKQKKTPQFSPCNGFNKISDGTQDGFLRKLQSPCKRFAQVNGKVFTTLISSVAVKNWPVPNAFCIEKLKILAFVESFLDHGKYLGVSNIFTNLGSLLQHRC